MSFTAARAPLGSVLCLTECRKAHGLGVPRNRRQAAPRALALRAVCGAPRPSAEEDGASTSGRTALEQWLPAVAPVAALAAAALLLLPAGAAHASGGDVPGMLEFVITFIEELGPLGPAAFVATVAIAECIPLFPTQPLSLASGLLFGTQKGALCMLSGSTLAALLAFQIARGVGRPLAERIINHELSSSSSADGSDGEGPAVQPNSVQRKLAEAMEAIERGSFWKQAGAVLLLRMTPLVPFSASNYVLGLSPLPLPPYLAGTFVGMAFWSVFYASLGGASRSLLRRGVDPELLVADMMDKAGQYTRELGIAAVVVGAAAVGFLGASLFKRRLAAAAAAAAVAAAGGEGGDAGAGTLRGAAVAEAHQLGRGLEISRSAIVGKELEVASLRLKEWLAAGGSGAAGAAPPPPPGHNQELIESHLKE